MADARVRAVITAEDRASGVIKGFSATSIAAFGAIAGVAQAVTARAIDTITQSVSDAVKRVDTLNNSTRVFANMGFAAGDVKKAMDDLKTSVLGLPTSLDSAVRGMQMIAATTGDIGKAQAVFSALNDAIIGFGGSADDVDGAILQLSQAFSNNRIDAQTWNSLMQNGLGPTLNAIAKQMGITTGALKDGLSDSSISVGQFQDALVTLDKKGGGGLKSLQTIAHDATSGIGTGIENAKTAITRGMANIIQAIGSERISSAISQTGSIIEKVFTDIAKIIPPTFELIAAGWNTLKRAIDFLMPSLQALWNTILTQLWPTLQRFYNEVIVPLAPVLGTILVGAIYVLINALNLFIQAWTFTTNVLLGFRDFVIGPFVGGVLAGFDWVVAKAIWLKDNFWSVVGEVVGFFATLPLKLPFYMAAAIEAVVGLLARVNWWAVISGLYGAFINMVGAIYNAFVGLVDRLVHLDWGAIGKSVANSIIGFVEGAINGALTGLPGNLKVHLPRFAQGVQNFEGGLAVVGERGPELVNLPKGSNVIPNDQIRSTSNSSVNLTVNVGLYAGSEIEKRKMAKEIFSALQDVANQKNTTVLTMLGA